MSKPKSAKLISLYNKAKRAGWKQYIRQGDGQEADERAMMDGCVFDPIRADHVVEFFETYGVLTEGPWKGKPFVPLNWQVQWLQRAFGWVVWNRKWNCWVRRFRYVYLEVPKKNGKTPLAATLGNYLLLGDSAERQINLFLAATTKQQANRCIKHAIRAYKYRPDLNAVVITKKLEGFDSVEYEDNLWQVVAADPDSADGVNGHVIGDEVHRWKGFEFFNTLRWALGTQPEGMFLGITTAGSNPESICRTLHDKTIEINSGRQIDQQFFGTIYAIGDEDDPHDPASWAMANPSLGETEAYPLSFETFRADYEAAKIDPTQWPTFLQLRLNRWRNAIDSWIDLTKWDLGKTGRAIKVAQRKRMFDAKNKRSRTPAMKAAKFVTPYVDCFEKYSVDAAPGGVEWKDLEGTMAFDGATVRDTTSAVFTFEHPTDDGVLLSLPFYWLPTKRAIELQDKVPFQSWADQGFITLTEGDAVDFNFILRDLAKLVKKFDIDEYYFDPLFQAEWLTERLTEETRCQRVSFPQTMGNFSPAMKTAERMIHNKTWRHNGHPIFTWQMGNVKAKHNANQDIRPEKQKHGDYRTIDGPVAAIMTMRKWTVIDDDDDGDEFEMG